MKCKYPRLSGSGRQAYGCQQCDHCLINRRRVWETRLNLEQREHRRSCFATLTMEDSELVYAISSRLPTLVRSDIKPFMDRLRKRFEPEPLRFFLVGEYGEKSERPHYHAIFFGFECVRGRTLRHPGSTRPLWKNCCIVCRTVGEAWGKGDVDLGEATPASISYSAQYVTKRLTAADSKRLRGREPEFSTMSRMPGLGRAGATRIAAQVKKLGRALAPEADVPSAILVGKKQLPIGRYLRRAVRKEIGRAETAPTTSMEENEFEVLYVRAHVENDHPYAKGDVKTMLIQNALADLDEQHRTNRLTRSAIFTKRRSYEES